MDALNDRLGHTVIDQSRQLGRWPKLLQELLPRVRDVYVFANTHYAGYAPATVREALAMLPSGREPGEDG